MNAMDFRTLKSFRDYQQSRLLGSRLTLIKALVIFFFVVQCGIFAYLQLVRGTHFRVLAEENRLHRRIERPLRGILLDDAGRVLVSNRPSFSIYMDLERTTTPDQEIQTLARYLELPPDIFQDRLERAKGQPRYLPVLLLPDAGLEMAARIEAHRPELPAIDVVMESKRYYPMGPGGAHVIGYLSEATDEEMAVRKDLFLGDRVGRIGAERVFDEELRGQPGIVLEEVNARGRRLGAVAYLRPTRFGRGIRMTLDSQMQKDIEEAFAGRGGAAVVLDPISGGIKALYSGPSFDPNLFAGRLPAGEWARLSEDPLRPLQNRALGSTYSPGSTFKIVMAVAAMQEGVVSPEWRVSCGGAATFYGRQFKCHKGGHGSVDLRDAIVRSCNVYFYTVGAKLGIDRIARWARAMGLGEVSDLPLKQAQGIAPSSEWKLKTRGEPWYAGETISVAIGQGYVQATPIQLAQVAAVIANGGYRVHAHLGERPGEAPPPQSLGIAPETIALIREAMEGVVARGTGRRAQVPGIRVAGKTGTAQNIGREAGKEIEDNALFIGFAPVDNPKLAWAIVVEQAGFGGEQAAPIAGMIVQRYFERRPLDSGSEIRLAQGPKRARPF